MRDTFWPDDVKHILQIPLREGAQDFIAWHYDSKGIHSVKSAYKLLAINSKADAHYQRNTAVCSNAEDSNIWSKLWKLSVPPKVRNFWWRVIKGLIPVRAILHKT